MQDTTVYKIDITGTRETGVFRVTWPDTAAGPGVSFISNGQKILAAITDNKWQKPQHQLDIGRALYLFLDGETGRLDNVLKHAAAQDAQPELHIHACPETADWPFELLTGDGGGFLVPHRLHLVRGVSQWGEKKAETIPERPMKLLFMACSALDVEPELDFEKEEETIFEVTRQLAVDMDVEDSGSLEGLRALLLDQPYDVVHLSGHADIDKKGQPYFIMEDETGYHCVVTPEELWEEALIENPPRVLFLSGCRTGERPENAAASFARRLVEDYHVQAVLGWGRSVSDAQAIVAEQFIYRELSRGKRVTEAVQRARSELERRFMGSLHPAWPLLRLFCGGAVPGALVKPGQKAKPKARKMVHSYLKNSQVKILEQGFVGRRRQLQQSLRALKQDQNKVGLLLHGTGGLGKSCLAGKLCERFEKHQMVVVHGILNAFTLEAALKDAFVNALDENGQAILAAQKEPAEKLAYLCASSFKEKNYLLVLDDFEQNLEGAALGRPGAVIEEAGVLLRVLLHYLPMSGKETQLIVTCRYGFELLEGERDLVRERLEWVPLTGFKEAELYKKARELDNILYYKTEAAVPLLLDAGCGNPRLMEFIDVLVGEMFAAEVAQLLEAVKDKREEFIRDHVVRELLKRGGKDVTRFLQWLSLYRRPVLIEGAELMAEKAGLKNWQTLLERGIGLSLLEYDRVSACYAVTPLLREELASEIDDCLACHEAAFAYYQGVCEQLEAMDPVLVEEYIYHALACGQEAVAARWGGRLVQYLEERLAFLESKRVGLWILEEKKEKTATADGGFLLNALAFTLNALGESRLAAGYFEQALTTARVVFGQKHGNVAVALNNLGLAWQALGESHKAIDYFEQALAIWRDVYGEKQGDVAVALNNLGLAWKTLGESRKAIDYYEQALAIDRGVYGEKHPDVARDLNNLGGVWYALGEFRKAIDYFQQALAIWKEVYGERHPNIASSLNNLGSAWDDLGESRKAIDYFEQALAIDREVYGENHPNVAIRLNNLGSLYLQLGDRERAKELLEKAYEICIQFYGPGHPHTKATARWLEEIEGSV